MRTILLVLALSALAACAGVETTPPPPEPQKLASIDEFLARQDELRAGLQDGSLGELSERDLEEVMSRQDELRALLSSVDSVDQLTETQKIEAFNAQNTINGIITRSIAKTPICRRETAVGTHRMRTVCMTARQRDDMRESSSDTMRDLQRTLMPLKN